MSEKHNGYANWETWNVALWLLNEEAWNRIAMNYLAETSNPTYGGLVLRIGLEHTPDGASFFSPAVRRKEVLKALRGE